MRWPLRGTAPAPCLSLTFPVFPISMRRNPLPVMRRLCLAAIFLTISCQPLRAQVQRPDSAAPPSPGTVLHTVRRGDTLYDIARAYLGNPLRWPELFRANARQIANANLIFPGQRLFVGADGKPTFVPPAVSVGEEPADLVPASTRPVVLGRAMANQSQSSLQNATLSGRALRPTVRAGEMAAAPFLLPVTAPYSGGALVSRADRTVLGSSSMRDQFQIFDDVNVLLPAGTPAVTGAKFAVFQRGPAIEYRGVRSRVMQPTGVVEIVAAGTGKAARARVVSVFATLRAGDLLLPLDAEVKALTVRPEPVANGPLFEVAYVAGGVVLPTVQNYIVIALPRGTSSRVGDQFALIAEGVSLSPTGKDVAPENQVARASVVKVTADGATAIIIGHDQPAVRVGMKARLVARMP